MIKKIGIEEILRRVLAMLLFAAVFELVFRATNDGTNALVYYVISTAVASAVQLLFYWLTGELL